MDPAGWGLQYGSLHPLKDVFRAQGQAALFPDDEDDTAEPDEEEVEPPMGYYIGGRYAPHAVASCWHEV